LTLASPLLAHSKTCEAGMSSSASVSHNRPSRRSRPPIPRRSRPRVVRSPADPDRGSLGRRSRRRSRPRVVRSPIPPIPTADPDRGSLRRRRSLRSRSQGPSRSRPRVVRSPRCQGPDRGSLGRELHRRKVRSSGRAFGCHATARRLSRDRAAAAEDGAPRRDCASGATGRTPAQRSKIVDGKG
jgi:hypothetical protein